MKRAVLYLRATVDQTTANQERELREARNNTLRILSSRDCGSHRDQVHS
jgi:hypothetical protein